ncbi:hypothetical protein EVAR_27540_1 [Eumeta japonica]|uniref:RRM domain-containing protein n=1 Tax=Eumeta variegata TaxID=151549 RepID=A0A4C1W5N1_EUMVA|nr:hypothetical protein EVAR_27540_1 [Eumeta japonica]
MMLDGGKIKEIQVKLLLSSRSEMHKVIEAARQSVPLISLQPALPVVATPAPVPAPAPAPAPVPVPTPTLGAFAPALGAATATGALPGLSIPGLGNPLEIPQPAVIEPPVVLLETAPMGGALVDTQRDDDRPKKDKDRRKSRSRSRDRDKKDRNRDKKDRRERSRSRERSRERERRRRDRSRSRERRDRKRDRRERSRSRERSPRRSRDRRTDDRRTSPQINSQENSNDGLVNDKPYPAPLVNNGGPGPGPGRGAPVAPQQQPGAFPGPRFGPVDPTMMEAFNRLQELGKKRNPNAFQGELHNGVGRGRGAGPRGAAPVYRRDGRPTRFDTEQRDCCVVIKNAPTHTSYGDVRRFFPYTIDKHGIKMINDATGRRTGTIYVRFLEPRSRASALQRERNELKGELVTVQPLDDAEYDTAVDSYLPCRDDSPADAPEPERPAEPAPAAARSPFTVLQLNDLPLFVKEHDIIKTFSEFSLLSIQLNECRATRTKSALVQFVKAEDALAALERPEPYMFGRRAAQVTPAPASAAAQVLSEPTEAIVINDVEQTAETPPVERTEPVAPRDPRQRRPPRSDTDVGSQPLLALPNPQAVSAFFAGSFPPQAYGGPFNGPQFGGFPAPVGGDPRGAAWSRPAFAGGARAPAPRADFEDEPQDCALMKGLPPDATDRTIVDFFSGTGAVPARIHLMLDAQGEPSGDCFCEFRSAQEAQRAIVKHGHELDGCRITVDLVARSVVEDALEGPKHAETDVRVGASGGSTGLLGEAPRLQPQYYESPAQSGFGGRGGPFRGRGLFEGRGRPFRRGGFERGRGFEPRARGRGYPLRSRGRGAAVGPRSVGAAEEESDPALEEFGAPGCVVSMENVPFRATIEEILEFFGEFELTQDDVIRRFNERGQPTGDARVAFRTPFDAQRAVSTKHMHFVRDRRVSLALL